MRTTPLSLILIALSGLLLHCQAQSTEDTELSSTALIDGEYTFENLAVGRSVSDKSSCTATLIAENVALTAAHCVGYRAVARGEPTSLRFTVADERTTMSSAVDEIVVFGSKIGADDIALLHLTSSLTGIAAVPLATTKARAGDDVTVFGFGCGNTKSERDDHSGKKQKKRYRWTGKERESCPGDSGGPHMFTGGGIFEVTSGHTALRDIKADTVKHRATILEWIAKWQSPTRCTPTEARYAYRGSICSGGFYFDRWTDDCGNKWQESIPSANPTCARCTDPEGEHANCFPF